MTERAVNVLLYDWLETRWHHCSMLYTTPKSKGNGKVSNSHEQASVDGVLEMRIFTDQLSEDKAHLALQNKIPVQLNRMSSREEENTDTHNIFDKIRITDEHSCLSSEMQTLQQHRTSLFTIQVEQCIPRAFTAPLSQSLRRSLSLNEWVDSANTYCSHKTARSDTLLHPQNNKQSKETVLTWNDSQQLEEPSVDSENLCKTVRERKYQEEESMCKELCMPIQQSEENLNIMVSEEKLEGSVEHEQHTYSLYSSISPLEWDSEPSLSVINSSIHDFVLTSPCLETDSWSSIKSADIVSLRTYYDEQNEDIRQEHSLLRCESGGQGITARITEWNEQTAEKNLSTESNVRNNSIIVENVVSDDNNDDDGHDLVNGNECINQNSKINNTNCNKVCTSSDNECLSSLITNSFNKMKSTTISEDKVYLDNCVNNCVENNDKVDINMNTCKYMSSAKATPFEHENKDLTTSEIESQDYNCHYLIHNENKQEEETAPERMESEQHCLTSANTNAHIPVNTNKDTKTNTSNNCTKKFGCATCETLPNEMTKPITHITELCDVLISGHVNISCQGREELEIINNNSGIHEEEEMTKTRLSSNFLLPCEQTLLQRQEMCGKECIKPLSTSKQKSQHSTNHATEFDETCCQHHCSTLPATEYLSSLEGKRESSLDNKFAHVLMRFVDECDLLAFLSTFVHGQTEKETLPVTTNNLECTNNQRKDNNVSTNKHLLHNSYQYTEQHHQNTKNKYQDQKRSHNKMPELSEHDCFYNRKVKQLHSQQNHWYEEHCKRKECNNNDDKNTCVVHGADTQKGMSLQIKENNDKNHYERENVQKEFVKEKCTLMSYFAKCAWKEFVSTAELYESYSEVDNNNNESNAFSSFTNKRQYGKARTTKSKEGENSLQFARIPLPLWHSFAKFANAAMLSCQRGLLVVEDAREMCPCASSLWSHNEEHNEHEHTVTSIPNQQDAKHHTSNKVILNVQGSEHCHGNITDKYHKDNSSLRCTLESECKERWNDATNHTSPHHQVNKENNVYNKHIKGILSHHVHIHRNEDCQCHHHHHHHHCGRSRSDNKRCAPHSCEEVENEHVENTLPIINKSKILRCNCEYNNNDGDDDHDDSTWEEEEKRCNKFVNDKWHEDDVTIITTSPELSIQKSLPEEILNASSELTLNYLLPHSTHFLHSANGKSSSTINNNNNSHTNKVYTQHCKSANHCGSHFKDCFLCITTSHLLFINSFAQVKFVVALQNITHIIYSSHSLFVPEEKELQHVVAENKDNAANIQDAETVTIDQSKCNKNKKGTCINATIEQHSTYKQNSRANKKKSNAKKQDYPFICFVVAAGDDVEVLPPLLLTFILFPLYTQSAAITLLKSPSALHDRETESYCKHFVNNDSNQWENMENDNCTCQRSSNAGATVNSMTGEMNESFTDNRSSACEYRNIHSNNILWELEKEQVKLLRVLRTLLPELNMKNKFVEYRNDNDDDVDKSGKSNGSVKTSSCLCRCCCKCKYYHKHSNGKTERREAADSEDDNDSKETISKLEIDISVNNDVQQISELVLPSFLPHCLTNKHKTIVELSNNNICSNGINTIYKNDINIHSYRNNEKNEYNCCYFNECMECKMNDFYDVYASLRMEPYQEGVLLEQKSDVSYAMQLANVDKSKCLLDIKNAPRKRYCIGCSQQQRRQWQRKSDSHSKHNKCVNVHKRLDAKNDSNKNKSKCSSNNKKNNKSCNDIIAFSNRVGDKESNDDDVHDKFSPCIPRRSTAVLIRRKQIM